ncbi:carbohydrate sulfotransferase 1-like [Ylistrum balloti]|uniref:carbohydrate sulfotransferase 1-like n=1 Tax=Ylistrum balloti TaxID=509963 RepID=UPI002905ABFB|nr:carbohydrate sulfotransferase 1-like [Ylistrum balloti]
MHDLEGGFRYVLCGDVGGVDTRRRQKHNSSFHYLDTKLEPEGTGKILLQNTNLNTDRKQAIADNEERRELENTNLNTDRKQAIADNEERRELENTNLNTDRKQAVVDIEERRELENTNVNTDRKQAVVDIEERRDATREKSQDGAQVLLVTYLRSGSTFLGEIVQQIDRLMYRFEPLQRYMEPGQYISRNKGFCFLSNDSCSPAPKMEYNSLMDVFRKFYKCDLLNLNRNFVKGVSSSFARKCYVETDPGKCLSDMIKYCQSSVRITKTIRLSMDVVQDLMKEFPKLKVIHLLRDPRGMIASRLKTITHLHFKDAGMPTIARAVCDKYNRDIQIGQLLKKKYPSRFKTVLYEQIAEETLKHSIQIFNFLELTPNSNFKTWLAEHISGDQKSTHPPDKRNRAFSTVRANSSATASSWRSRLKFNQVKEIDNECSQFYDYSGYLAVKNSNTLNDLTLPVRRKNINFL